MDLGLQEKNVLITGAAGGIGSAIAQVFAEEGANLALLDKDPARLEQLSMELCTTHHAEVAPVVADLSKEQEVRRGIEEALAPLGGRVDVLIAAVGVLIAAPTERIANEQWQDALAINLLTHVWVCQAVLPLMQQQGEGSIVLIGSDQGSQPDAGLAPYAIAKSGLHAFGKVLAREQAKRGIRVNVVAPGMTRTPLVIPLLDRYAEEFGVSTHEEAELRELTRRDVPMRRLARPAEIADVVLWAASKRASYMTGSILDVSGGNKKGW